MTLQGLALFYAGLAAPTTCSRFSAAGFAKSFTYGVDF
jgi:hypothetical protein